MTRTEQRGGGRGLCTASAIALLLGALAFQAVPAAAAWEFTERPIEDLPGGPAAGPQIARDVYGNLFAVWIQSDGTYPSVWSSRAPRLGEWGEPELLENATTGPSKNVRIAVSVYGWAVAVWQTQDVGRWDIYASEYTVNIGWSAAHLIETEASYSAMDPNITMDPYEQYGWVVWSQSNGSLYNIWGTRYSVGGGWGAPELLEFNDSGDALYPQVAASHFSDVFGNDAVLAWTQNNGTADRVWVKRHETASGGWGYAMNASGANRTDGAAPRLVCSSTYPPCVVVWSEEVAGAYALFARRYDDFGWFGGRWGPMVRVSDEAGGNPRQPDAIFSTGGHPVFVWTQNTTIRYAREDDNGTLLPSAAFETRAANTNSERPKIIGAGHGNWMVVWQRMSSGVGNLHLSTFATPGPPSSRASAESQSGNATQAAIAPDSEGNAIILWLQTDSKGTHVWERRWSETFRPQVQITEPAWGSVVNGTVVVVRGYAEQYAKVTVNGISVTPASNGSFYLYLALQPGPNYIQADAVDARSNRASNWTQVTVVAQGSGPPPELASLWAAINASIAETAALEASLNASMADLDAAIGAVAQAEARVDAIEANGSATEAELDAAKAELVAAQDDLNELGSSLDGLQAEMAASRSELDSLSAALVTTQVDVVALRQSVAVSNAALANATEAFNRATQALVNASASQNATDARLSALENKEPAPTPQIPEPYVVTTMGGDITAMLLGFLALMVGGAGLVLGLRAQRQRAGGQQEPHTRRR